MSSICIDCIDMDFGLFTKSIKQQITYEELFAPRYSLKNKFRNYRTTKTDVCALRTTPAAFDPSK